MKKISARIIAHSIANNIELITMQMLAPKFLDAEFEKHRMISSNSSSDRAIPLDTLIAISDYLPKDIRFNQNGMQGREVMSDDEVALFHEDLIKLHGYTKEIITRWNHVHKQHVNRYFLGFSWQNKIATATEWDNFFNLRLHPDAQPEMQELARVMKEAMEASSPQELAPGEWHLPYVYINGGGDLEECIKMSVARCARVSFLNHDNSTPNIDKDIALYDKLLEAGHMSPFEHVATPMKQDSFNVHAEEGITHIDKYDNLWSGNFKSWIQHRQLLSAV